MNPPAPKPTWSVIVSSCDAYSDLWPFFFHFFEKHWPDAPKPVHLVSNFRRFESPSVKTLAVGPDKSWGDTIHAALEQIPDDFVVFVLDDFFLNTPVPAGWVDSLVGQLEETKGDFVSLYNFAPTEKRIEGLPLLSRIEERMECPGFHASLFRRSYLMELASARQNIWRTEALMRDHADTRPGTQFNLALSSPYKLTYVESVRGCFWKPNGVQYLKDNGLKPDLRRRPFPPQGEGPWAKVVRSFHKRRMRLREKAMAGKAETIHPLGKS